MCLARGGLAIRKDGAIVAAEALLNDWLTHVLIHIGVVMLVRVHFVEGELVRSKIVVDSRGLSFLVLANGHHFAEGISALVVGLLQGCVLYLI